MTECPYSCTNGFIFDPYTHRKKICPHCSEERKEKARTGKVREELKLPPSLTNGNFIPSAVIPESERKLLEEDSVDSIVETMENLIRDLSIGILPNESMLFNFGRRAYDSNFIAPLLTKAYVGGLSAVPLLTSLDIVRSRQNVDKGEDKEATNIVKYDSIIKSNVCVILIDAGSTYEEILAIKGVMQLRAMEQLPTIMVTHVWNYNVGCLYAEEGAGSYSLATLYQVKYNQRGGNKSTAGSTQRLSGEMFKEIKSLGL